MQAQYIRRLTGPLALSMALAIGACADRGNRSDTALATDTALNRDLALAGRDTAAQPQLRDVPSGTATTPAPRATTPRATTPRATTPAPKPTTPTKTASGNTVTTGNTGGGGTVGSIAAGTTINLTSNERVCTNTHKAGDKFTATVTSPVTGSNGAVIPAGSTAVVTITSSKRSENANDPVVFTFNVNSINVGGRAYPVTADVTSAKVDEVSASSKNAQKIAIGAAVGAVAGQILGKNTKGTIIGAATGAAAGTAVAMATSNKDGCIPQGGSIVIRLTEPASIKAE
jgi:YmgG-like glycine-zipper protein